MRKISTRSFSLSSYLCLFLFSVKPIKIFYKIFQHIFSTIWNYTLFKVLEYFFQLCIVGDSNKFADFGQYDVPLLLAHEKFDFYEI